MMEAKKEIVNFAVKLKLSCGRMKSAYKLCHRHAQQHSKVANRSSSQIALTCRFEASRGGPACLSSSVHLTDTPKGSGQDGLTRNPGQIKTQIIARTEERVLWKTVQSCSITFRGRSNSL